MTIEQFHRYLLGIPPTEDQGTFYKFGGRGVNFSGLDKNGFRAVFVRAVYHAKDGPVILVVSKALEKKVLAAIQENTREICRRFKGQEMPVKAFTDRIKQLKLVSRYLQPDEEPAQWFSVGLGEKDPIPEWLRNKLWTKI
jgi:hypothetical protein